MKKIILLIELVVILLMGCLSTKNADTENINTENRVVSNKEESINLVGEWKVTEQVASQMMLSDHSIEEHYWGRSITIGPETIITSLNYWPNGINYKIDRYCMVESEIVSSKDSRFYGKNYLDEGWEKALGDQDLTLVTYSMGEEGYSYDKQSFLVTQDGRVICEYFGRYYFMERYKEAEIDVSIEKLLGKWYVKRLVSYQNNWKGNNSVAVAWERTYNRPISEEEGANFYPEEFINNIVEVEAEGIKLYQKNRLVESYMVEDYISLLMNKYDYQKEKGVYDGLGIVNEEIQVFKDKGLIREGKILEGEIIVINEKEIVMKLYQGWYLLEKGME